MSKGQVLTYLSSLMGGKDNVNRLHAMRKHGYIYENVVSRQCDPRCQSEKKTEIVPPVYGPPLVEQRCNGQHNFDKHLVESTVVVNVYVSAIFGTR